MKFKCTIEPIASGWSIRHASQDVGTVEVTASSRELAVEKITGELRYRLELCPCSGESYQHLQIELEEIPRDQ